MENSKQNGHPQDDALKRKQQEEKKPTEQSGQATTDNQGNTDNPGKPKEQPVLDSTDKKSDTVPQKTPEDQPVQDSTDKKSHTDPQKTPEDQPVQETAEKKDETEDLLDSDPTHADAYEVDDYDPDSNDHRDHDPEEENEKKANPAREPEVKEQKVNYGLLNKEDLVNLLEEKMNSLSFNQLRDLYEEIHAIFQEKSEQETAEKKKAFLAEGGNEEDFKPVDDPVDQKMQALVDKYRSLKSDFNKQMERSKEENLKEKEEILVQFRELMEGQDTFENTFRNFKKLQHRWFDIGIVPQQNVRDLWNSYNFFVDKFNDYVKINRELRVLDLKKNLDLKTKLCEQAEALAEEKDIVSAFKTLQKYHARWREIGPVSREEKETIWERFKAATAVINKAHQAHQAEMRESLMKNLEKKEEICEAAEQIASGEYQSHKDWSRQTNALLGLQEDWKKIGYAPKKHNNKIYSRFRKACDIFFGKKAEFYAQTYEEQKENLQKKLAIVEEVEQLKERTEWKETTDQIISLQKKWKEIGPVPRKESDKLWKRFRAACDYFFDQKSGSRGTNDADFKENLKKKEALLEEMKAYDPAAGESRLEEDLDRFQVRYNEIGFVPMAKKDEIRDRFKDEVSGIISRAGLPEKDESILLYRIRMLGILASPKSRGKFRNERDKLFTRLQQLKNDIGVLENNIGFFKETENAEGTISEYHEKLKQAKVRIEVLEGKLSVLDDLERDYQG